MTEQHSGLPMPPLSEEDAAVFDRVWHRVMAGREMPEMPNLPVPTQ